MSSNAMKKSIDVNVSSILKLFTNILLHFLSIQIEFPIISRKIWNVSNLFAIIILEWSLVDLGLNLNTNPHACKHVNIAMLSTYWRLKIEGLKTNKKNKKTTKKKSWWFWESHKNLVNVFHPLSLFWKKKKEMSKSFENHVTYVPKRLVSWRNDPPFGSDTTIGLALNN